VSRRRRVVGYLLFDGDGSASTGAPAWPRSPSASVAIDWDVAVTLARPSFQPLYAALYCGAGGDGVHGVATYFGLMPRIEDSNNRPVLMG